MNTLPLDLQQQSSTSYSALLLQSFFCHILLKQNSKDCSRLCCPVNGKSAHCCESSSYCLLVRKVISHTFVAYLYMGANYIVESTFAADT